MFQHNRFSVAVIRQAPVRLYFRFSLSLHVIEELMAARGIDVSIRCWTIKFGPQITR